MQPGDETKFAKLLIALGEVFPSEGRPSALKIELYYKALEAYSIEEITKAVENLIAERLYHNFPTPGEIRERLGPQINKTAAKIARMETEDWLYGNGPVPKDPVTCDVIQSYGGVQRLTIIPFDELKWTLKDLEDRYQALLLKPKCLPRSENKKVLQLADMATKDMDKDLES